MADIIDSNHANPEGFYKSLKAKLEEQHNFPEEYLFKFIVKSNPEKNIVPTKNKIPSHPSSWML